MIVPGMLVCISFLISMCMFIVSKALLISSASVIVNGGRAIWLNPFATVLLNVYSAVTVECCVLYPCCLYVCYYVRKKALLQCFAIIDGWDMGQYEVHLSMSLLGFGMGTMLANFHLCGIMLLLRAVLNMLMRDVCFRCLMFSLSGPCEFLFFTLFYFLLDLSCGDCVMLYPCIFCVALLMNRCVFCVACMTVFVS